jgi:hypothetical protein
VEPRHQDGRHQNQLAAYTQRFRHRRDRLQSR